MTETPIPETDEDFDRVCTMMLAAAHATGLGFSYVVVTKSGRRCECVLTTEGVARHSHAMRHSGLVVLQASVVELLLDPEDDAGSFLKRHGFPTTVQRSWTTD